MVHEPLRSPLVSAGTNVQRPREARDIDPINVGRAVGDLCHLAIELIEADAVDQELSCDLRGWETPRCNPNRAS